MAIADIKLLVLNVNLALQDKTDGGNKLIRKQSSIFLHGARGSGKTTLLNRASGMSAREVVEGEGPTIGDGQNVLIGKKGKPPIIIADYSGDNAQKDMDGRFRKLDDFRPLAILILLDHAPRDEDFNKLYVCPPDGKLPTDTNNFIRKRFEEHKKAIVELKRIFELNPRVAEQCRLVLPIVNKWDAWRTMGYKIEHFARWYNEPLNDLNEIVSRNKIAWHNPIPLSGLLEGFGNVLNIIEERGGKEWFIKVAENPFFTIVVRRATKSKIR